MTNVIKIEQEKLYTATAKILKEPYIPNQEKINHCLELLDPTKALGEILFKLIPGEKPYQALFAIIELIKDNLFLNQPTITGIKREKLTTAIKNAIMTILNTLNNSFSEVAAVDLEQQVDSLYIIENSKDKERKAEEIFEESEQPQENSNNPELSEIDKIAICYQILKQCLYTRTHLMPAYPLIAQKIKDTIDTINMNNVIFFAENYYGSSIDSHAPQVLVLQLKNIIPSLLRKRIKDKKISASENIEEWCDAISPDGRIGEILFSSGNHIHSNLNSDILKIINFLSENFNAKIQATDNPDMLYDKLTKNLLSTYSNSSSNIYKIQLQDVIKKVFDYKSIYKKKLEQQRLIFQVSPASFFSGQSTYLELEHKKNRQINESDFLKNLRTIILSDHDGKDDINTFICNKINRCRDILVKMSEKNIDMSEKSINLPKENISLKTAFILIDLKLISQLKTSYQAGLLAGILETLITYGGRSDQETKTRYNKMIAKLNCWKILNHKMSANNADIMAIYQGIRESWKYLYVELTNIINTILPKVENQIIIDNKDNQPVSNCSNLLNSLNNLMQSTELNGQYIAQKVADILVLVNENEHDDSLLFMETYKELMTQLSKTTSISEIRNIFYKELLGIDASQLKWEDDKNMIDDASIERQLSYSFI